MAGLMLTQGAVERMASSDTSFQPILQVLDVKQIGNPQANPSERFRLVVSDGQWSTTAMLATQMNQVVKENLVRKLSIIRLDEFLCNTVQGRKIVIVLNLQVLDQCPHKIGEPVVWRDQPEGAGAPQAVQAPPPSAGFKPGIENMTPNVGGQGAGAQGNGMAAHMAGAAAGMALRPQAKLLLAGMRAAMPLRVRGGHRGPCGGQAAATVPLEASAGAAPL
eukprot:CAMPEP_0177579188 /NCGR_PEP_ID=MMETSP0419_2-20121207/808_1 /TAXON_ID=582737 /ORGANISM="Tetraselmis sp., Strain GSL018" /LENGTH=219 /DNA_ID=CAMNT_0019067801 /DNA_START=184 /DNA_END=841 /DNA_ORIENTATION=+